VGREEKEENCSYTCESEAWALSGLRPRSLHLYQVKKNENHNHGSSEHASAELEMSTDRKLHAVVMQVGCKKVQPLTACKQER
jgi:hypothetical protein